MTSRPRSLLRPPLDDSMIRASCPPSSLDRCHPAGPPPLQPGEPCLSEGSISSPRIPPEEYKRTMRRLEMEAYSTVMSAFRAQGDLTEEKKHILNELQTTLG